MRVVDVFAELLRVEGIDCVFTVPGGTAVPLLEAVSRLDSVRVVVAKDEAGATYAADGYAWASGKPGVVITIGGPGATNTLTALCVSRVQGNPVIVVSGEVGSHSMGRGAVQDGSDLGLDVVAMSSAATALSAAASTPAKAVFALMEAFRRAIHQRAPVHVSIPLDVQAAEVDVPARLRSADYRAEVEPWLATGAVPAAARCLATAKRPAILVGRGGRAAGREILALAEALGAPVATTCGAKGVFPERHPLSLGVFSFGSGALARKVLCDAGVDVLCVIGSRLGEFSSMNFARTLAPSGVMVHVDRESCVVGRNYAALPVIGDAKLVLSEILREISGSPRREGPPWFAEFEGREARVADAAAEVSNAVPIRPERVMRELGAALPSDAVVVADIGTSCLFVAHYLRLQPPQACYIPMAWSCMAHPIAASVGVRLGARRPTVCVTGDAAFLSKGLELHAAVEGGLSRFVWIVLSNRGHGLVRLGTDMLLEKGHGVEAGDFRTTPDIAAVARALGARGEVVTDPARLGGAIAKALVADEPVVLDVRVDPDAVPPMADRIQGLRRASGSEAA